MVIDLEEFERKNELNDASFDIYENKTEYNNETFPTKDSKAVALRSVWEYIIYLEISLDCFDVAMENITVDFSAIKKQIGNYAKKRLEFFIETNDYIDCYDTVFNFSVFNGNLINDADLLYKMSCKGEMQKYLEDESNSSTLSKIEKKNKILNGDFIVDTYPYYKTAKFDYKDSFLDFWTNKEVFQELYDCVKKEIESNKDKDFSYTRSWLIKKLTILDKKRDLYSERLFAASTNQTLINWYILLQKYIDMAISLIDTVTTSKLDTKLIVYIFKTLCKNGMNINVTDESFVSFIKELMGTSLSTTEKYLKSSNMSYDGFVNTWLKGLELLSSLDKENPLIRKGIREALKDKPVKLLKPLSLEQEEFIQKLKEEYP